MSSRRVVMERVALVSAIGRMRQATVLSTADVWDDVGEPVAIMRRLKEQYDPERVLNPGRFVGGI